MTRFVAVKFLASGIVLAVSGLAAITNSTNSYLDGVLVGVGAALAVIGVNWMITDGR